MGDGFINRENMFQLLRTSLISQAGEEDAEESVRVTRKKLLITVLVPWHNQHTKRRKKHTFACCLVF